MTPRTFIGLCAFVLSATGALLLLTAWRQAHPRGHGAFRQGIVSACPYLREQGESDNGPAQASIRAYAAIDNALAGGSLEGVPENADCIARFFREVNPDIAASARRLTRLRALPAARLEFRRLTDLFSRSPDNSGAPADREADSSRRLLEI